MGILLPRNTTVCRTATVCKISAAGQFGGFSFIAAALDTYTQVTLLYSLEYLSVLMRLYREPSCIKTHCKKNENLRETKNGFWKRARVRALTISLSE